MTPGTKALFLDRDGTLIEDRNYLADPAGVKPLPGTAAALQRARDLGYRLFLFSNQSGVGRGLHSLDDVRRVNARMVDLLGLGTPGFDDVCIAPETPEQLSRYRKPSPRFILESIARYRLDPAHCCMVGDKPDDLRTGLAAGVRAVLVLTGKVSDPRELPEDVKGRCAVFADLAALVATLD